MIQLLAVLLLFGLDQASKRWATAALAGGSRDLGLLSLTLVQNRGAAFGLGQNYSGLIAVMAGVFLLLGFLVLFLKSPKTAFGRWGLILLLAGAGGNLADRIRLGAVVDFIDFRFWPVFNLADTWITCGTILLALAFWKLETQEGK